ncbi:MAG: hypothetical protein LBN37_03330 [Bacteroidales bacterium]|jgi:DNA-binding transcriptional regulator LsrR (DeoR family)|nr:hypothetical protein [Bacteroidales bacterium]
MEDKKTKKYDLVKELARIRFMDGYKQKELAKELGVSEQSICRWAKAGNWDALKKNLVTASSHRIMELYGELEALNNSIKTKDEGKRFANNSEAAVRRQIIKDIADLEKKYNIGQATVIARDFVLFSKDIDFPFSQKANEYLNLFINHLIEKQKWQE